MTKLEKMLKYVSEHNEFYKNRIKEYGIKDPLDITQWPVLTRKELQENRFNMFSDGYKNKYYEQKLIRQFSSGSSGMPITVYWDYSDWYASNMALWRKRYQWYDIKPHNKKVIFTLNAFGDQNDTKPLFSYLFKNTLSINVSLINSIDDYNKVVLLINDFKPDWLYVQPFVLNKLILSYQYLDQTPPQSIKYIESVGEILQEDLRNRAVKMFRKPVVSMYGSEEMNGIAIENVDGDFETLEENVLVEVLNDVSVRSWGMGNAIITNINNHAMPLIRYCQDDRIIIKNDPQSKVKDCPKRITRIMGRHNESIVLKNGVEINTFLLSEIISEVNNIFSDIIIEYKYIYIKSKNVLKCIIVLKNEHKAWSTEVKDNILILLNRKLDEQVNIVLDITTGLIHQTNIVKAQFLEVIE